MEDTLYIYGMGRVPEGAISNGQGGWYYPESGNIGEPIDFSKIADNMYNAATPEEKVRMDKIKLFWEDFFKDIKKV